MAKSKEFIKELRENMEPKDHKEEYLPPRDLLVNLTYGNLLNHNDGSLSLTDIQLDKTYDEVLTAVKAGIPARVTFSLDLSAMGVSGNFPMRLYVPFSMISTADGVEWIGFLLNIVLGTVKAGAEVTIKPTSTQGAITMS